MLLLLKAYVIIIKGLCYVVHIIKELCTVPAFHRIIIKRLCYVVHIIKGLCTVPAFHRNVLESNTRGEEPVLDETMGREEEQLVTLLHQASENRRIK